MRYKGQGHEITVPVPPDGVDAAGLDALHDRFVAVYRSLYSRHIPGLAVEVLSWTLTVSTEPPPIEPVTDAPDARPVAASGAARVVDQATGDTVEAATYDRDALTPGATVPGPALVVEDQTTTVAPDGFHVSVDLAGNLRLRRAR